MPRGQVKGPAAIPEAEAMLLLGCGLGHASAPRAPPRARLPAMSAAPKLRVERDPEAVGLALCQILAEEYKKNADVRGSFSFAISGGSMIKMLRQLRDTESVDWSKCTMAFVSHRCVPLDDDGATYHKARPAFLDSWMAQGLRVITPTGTVDAEAEADTYEEALRGALPTNSDGLPVFDLCLIGMGMDGHVGSIYPGIPDVESRRPIVPITGVDAMGKLSTKLSMSIPAMLASKVSVVACAGKSAKAPLGKAQAVKRALETDETPMSFPASALRHAAVWLIDEDSSVLLSDATRLAS